MIMPLPRLRVSFTGRARARPGFMGRQVLQVELLVTTHNPADLDRQHPLSVRTEWRDATWEDLQAAPGFVLGTPRDQGGAGGTPPTGPSGEPPCTGNSNPDRALVHSRQLC